MYLMLYLLFCGPLEYAICSWCKFILRSFFFSIIAAHQQYYKLTFYCGCGYWPGFVFTL